MVGGSVSAFDALHDIREVSKLPITSSLRTRSPLFGTIPFSHPDIENRPQITSFDATTDSITFADGSTLRGKEVDIVLFATGYDFSFPFLPDLKKVHKRVPGLYQHIFRIENPTLAFVGMVLSLSPFVYSEMVLTFGIDYRRFRNPLLRMASRHHSSRTSWTSPTPESACNAAMGTSAIGSTG